MTLDHQSETQIISFDDLDILLSDNVTCMDVVFNNELKFSTYIKWLAGKCFYHIYQMHSLYNSLSINARITLVHMFITSQIDNCNCQVAVSHLRPLQSVMIVEA